jgi:sensor domain CHASE-containing protein
LLGAFIVGSPGVAVTAVMVVVAVVHEQVHQRARQQERVRQETQYVGTVFREQEKSANGCDDQQRDACA